VIPNARLCKALIDRITDRANIVETGTESYRFRRTLKNARPKVWKLRASTAPPLAETVDKEVAERMFQAAA
jgi:hypothetical protein